MNKLVLSAVILLVLDGLFIYANSAMFKRQIMAVQGSPLQINAVGAVLCYLFLIGGLYYFILKNKRPVQDAFLLGLVIYGVYETTTYALLKNWNFATVMVDTLWGGFLLALTTYFTYQSQLLG
jgi:uncharacterized membrane protein